MLSPRMSFRLTLHRSATRRAQGNADAEYVLGERYETGKGVPQDLKAAAECKSACQ